MSRVYGVLPSRRLGRSLGVSPIPFKTCDYSCVYCQLGRTNKMVIERKAFFPSEAILEEFDAFVHENGEGFDIVTIVGEGEPTLYKPLDKVIKGIKKIANKPVALITNGSLLREKSVREEIMESDIVLPTLDCWDQDSFAKINRPYGKLDFERVYGGFLEFSKDFKGEIWPEVMLVKGINDCDEAIDKLKKRINVLNPDRVYINVPIRPPAEENVLIPDKKQIEKAREILGAYTIDKFPKREFLLPGESPFEGILEVIKRHPLSKKDIESLIDEMGIQDTNDFFSRMDRHPQVEKCFYNGLLFYRHKEGK